MALLYYSTTYLQLQQTIPYLASYMQFLKCVHTAKKRGLSKNTCGLAGLLRVNPFHHWMKAIFVYGVKRHHVLRHAMGHWVPNLLASPTVSSFGDTFQCHIDRNLATAAARCKFLNTFGLPNLCKVQQVVILQMRLQI